MALIGYIIYAKCGQKVEKKPKESEVHNELKLEYKMTDNSLSDFDLYFMKLENEPNKNLVYSPLSIKYALEMLSEGAAGDTKTQIDAILGGYKAGKYTNSANMSLANALFIRDTFKSKIKSTYIETLQSKYNADVVYDSFKSADTINKWVSNKTLKLIDKLLSDDKLDEIAYVLVNALGIDMEWVNKIEDEDRFEYGADLERFDLYVGGLMNGYPSLGFENLNNEVKAVDLGAYANRYDIVNALGEESIKNTLKDEYQKWITANDGDTAICDLHNKEFNDLNDAYFEEYLKGLNSNYKKIGSSTDFMFYNDDTVKVFAKDLKKYNGTTLQYVGIMPITGGLNNYIENLKAQDLNFLIASLKPIELDSFEDGYATKITASIPLFNYEAKFDLSKDLKKMGMTDVFDSNKADLSNIAEGTYINLAEHMAKIEFSNEGIKAAAATALGGDGDAWGPCFTYSFEIPVKTIDLTFNRPYIYFVRNKDTGEVWFAGSVYEPSKAMSYEDYLEY